MTSDKEKDICDHLVSAFKGWCDLDDKHPDDVNEFRFHIHALQNMIAWRVARRADPEYWGAANTEPSAREEGTLVKLGVVEFHSDRLNPGLIERFYAVTDDLRGSGSIVDLWLMDIAAVLNEFGYDMKIRRLHGRRNTP